MQRALAQAIVDEQADLDCAVVAAALGRRALPAGIAPPGRFFGAFVTCSWPRVVERRATTDEEQIHGCIGFWEEAQHPDSPISEDRLREVAASALDADPRGEEYRREKGDGIRYEPDLMVKVSFMQSPIEIDDGGLAERPFDARREGIIVNATDGSGRRATFLPDVMTGKPWSYVLTELLRKAGIPETSSSYRLTRYTTMTYACRLFDAEVHIVSRVAGPEMADAFTRFVEAHTDRRTGVPPLERLADGSAHLDASDTVRNTSTLADAIDQPPGASTAGAMPSGAEGSRTESAKALRVTPSKAKGSARLRSWLDAYLSRFVVPLGKEGAQAASFAVGYGGAQETALCNILRSRTNDLEALDPVFEMPEVAIGLLRCGELRKNAPLVARLVRRGLAAAADRDVAVFALNWTTQLWSEILAQGVAVPAAEAADLEQALVRGWASWSSESPSLRSQPAMPANELAVAFEGLTHLLLGRAAVGGDPSGAEGTSGEAAASPESDSLRSLWMRLSAEVSRRGPLLVTQTTGPGSPRCRLDITGHVLRAIRLIP
jgi:AMMECR1 domain-containing protein